MIASRSLGAVARPNPLADRRGRRAALVSVAIAAGVAALFYSSFLTAPGSLLEPFRGAGTYLDRGVNPADHAHPWSYYLQLLAYESSEGVTWTEGLVLLLAAIGMATAWRQPGRVTGVETFWARYLTIDVLVCAAVFSAIPYKTPWNVLPFYAAALALAGVGFSRLIQWPASRIGRGTLAAACIVACAQLGQQAWRASVTYASDPRNPWVYAQTVPDAVRMATRIRELAALHPDGLRMQVSVIAPASEQWPLPWYLRAMPLVGYWTSPDDPVALQAPVLVASLDNAPALDASLGERYVSEYYGLRPDVLQTLYVERTLWDRFLASVAGGDWTRPCTMGPSTLGDCARPLAVAAWRTAGVR